MYIGSLPGKIMAYASLGNLNEEFLRDLQTLFKTIDLNSSPLEIKNSFREGVENLILRKLKEGYEPKDLITTSCVFLRDLLVKTLKDYFKHHKPICNNLCLCGGSFLNINYNTSLREQFSNMNIWVPPFTNDSGSSIGAALSAKFLLT